MATEVIQINGINHRIEYRETQIGDEVWDKNNEMFYVATIVDADDFNWIIID